MLLSDGSWGAQKKEERPAVGSVSNRDKRPLTDQAAARAVRISADRDLEPVFLMMAARWLSTVR
jgi:hypothetical protein